MPNRPSPTSSNAQPTRLHIAVPVRGKTDVTVNGADWLSAAPFAAVPSTSTVWLPAAALDGIVMLAETTPPASALTVASVTGSEWKMICADELAR